MLKFSEDDTIESLPPTNFKQIWKYLNKEDKLDKLFSYYNNNQNYIKHNSLVEIQCCENTLKNMVIKDFLQCLDALQYEAPLMLFKTFENVKIVKEPNTELYVNHNDHFSIECLATGFPRPIYQWFIGKKLLEGQDKSIISINSAQLEHEGFYICRIHNNGHKNAIFTRWCFVNVKQTGKKVNPCNSQKNKCQMPRITRHPVANLKVDENSSFSLNCCALGLPHPSIQWFKDHDVLHGSTHPAFNVERASLSSEGCYQCKVWNDYGIIWSVESTVKVIPQKTNSRLPEIIYHPQSPSDKIIIGSSIILGCKATGDEPLHYEWYRNSKVILGAETNELKFVNLQSDVEEGAYQCRVYNSFGSALSKPAIIRLDSLNDRAQFTASSKVALLIGNYDYPAGLNPLATVERDTKVLEKHLTELGFYVYSFLNLDLSQMKVALEFVSTLIVSPRSYCLFFFGGHGFEKFGKSYLVPVDVDPATFGPVDCLCVEREVLHRLQLRRPYCPAFIVILLDICRQEGGPSRDDNLVLNGGREEGSESNARSKFGLDPKSGSGLYGGGNYVFGYATSASSQAYEMEGQEHSIFMTHLFKYIAKELPFEEVLRKVRESVYSEPLTRNTLQFPEIKTNLSRSFSLADKVVPVADAAEDGGDCGRLTKAGVIPQTVPLELALKRIQR